MRYFYKKFLFFILITFTVIGLFVSKSFSLKENGAALIFGFVGDVMIGRLVNEILQQKPTLYIWGNLLENLHATDLNLANLETTLTKNTNPVPKVFNFKSDPEHVQALKEARFDIVNLANNHSLDFGVEGLQDTLKALDSEHILHVGAGMNATEARKPLIITKKGIKIGIIGATDNEPGWKAQENKAGVNYFKVCEIDQLKEDIKKLKKNVDIVILSLHWGPNMRERPTADYIECAHSFIDAGVDILHGHSAHVTQGVERYKNKLIMYDTGDFIDDYVVGPVLRNDRSCLFIVKMTKQGIKSLHCIPVKIAAMQVNRAQNAEAQEIIKRLQQLSAEFATEMDKKGFVEFK